MMRVTVVLALPLLYAMPAVAGVYDFLKPTGDPQLDAQLTECESHIVQRAGPWGRATQPPGGPSYKSYFAPEWQGRCDAAVQQANKVKGLTK